MTEKKKKRKIVLLVGSRSDIPNVRDGINVLRIAAKRGLIEWEVADVCSAHRNGARLREIIKEHSDNGVDAIIAVAGKLAALFGDVDAYLRNELGNSTTRVIAVPLKGKTEQASLAALYSVLEVPNHKLIFEEEFFHNPTAAFEHAIIAPLDTIVLEEQKPAERLSPADAYELARIKFPGAASYDDVIRRLEAGGLYHVYTGKTRETFINPDFPNLLFILATDRISIFDIVLRPRVDKKGAVLTAMTVDRLTKDFADIPNHLVAHGSNIVSYLPIRLVSSLSKKELCNLMETMLVVKKTKVLKVEAIVRGYLTGSGYIEYTKTGMVCGIKLPDGLVDGSKLPEPIFTPSTKADYGLHDENITFDEAVAIIGLEAATKVRDISLHLYQVAHDKSKKDGIIIADTKFEFGEDEDGNIRLIDEVLTPDSSRFWPEELMAEAMAAGKTPPSYDKQETRDEGLLAGVKDGVAWIPPDDLLVRTSEKYLLIAKLQCGKPLEQFQKEDMGIPQ